MNFTSDEKDSKLGCLRLWGLCAMDVYFSFSKNKDSDGDNKRESFSQMMRAAEDGSCRKQKRLIMGVRGEGDGRLWFCIQTRSAALGSLYLLQWRNYCA